MSALYSNGHTIPKVSNEERREDIYLNREIIAGVKVKVDRERMVNSFVPLLCPNFG